MFSNPQKTAIIWIIRDHTLPFKRTKQESICTYTIIIQLKNNSFVVLLLTCKLNTWAFTFFTSTWLNALFKARLLFACWWANKSQLRCELKLNLVHPIHTVSWTALQCAFNWNSRHHHHKDPTSFEDYFFCFKSLFR